MKTAGKPTNSPHSEGTISFPILLTGGFHPLALTFPRRDPQRFQS